MTRPRLLGMAALGICLLVGPPSALAIILSPVDLATISLGTQISADSASDFMTIDLTSQGGEPSKSIGTLTGSVWQNGSVFTYKLVVTPSVTVVHEFNTGFNVVGFSKSLHKVGWSFADAAAAGAVNPGAAFGDSGTGMVIRESDGTIDWNVQPTDLFWSGGESIAFFFQSSLPPGFGPYNLLNSEAGIAANYAPTAVPEPTTLLLLGPAGFVALWFRRYRARRATGVGPA